MNQLELKQEMCQAIDDAREYSFGMMDATVYALSRKSTFYVKDNIRELVYKYENWKDAANKARMIVAEARAM